MKSIINFLKACRDYVDYGYALLDSFNYTINRFDEVSKKRNTDANDTGTNNDTGN